MTQYLHITKNNNGTYAIHDTISGQTITYYFYGLTEAIKKHRLNTHTIGKHFKKLYYGGITK